MLEDIVATLLAKAPKERYQNCELLAQDLRAVLAGEERNIHPFFQATGDSLARRQNSETIDQDFKRSALKRTAVIASAATLLIATLVTTAGTLNGGTTGTDTGTSTGTKVMSAKTSPASTAKVTLSENAFIKDQDLWQKASPAVVRKNDFGPDSLQDKTPFVQTIDEQGHKFKIVQLPSDINIGRVFNDEPKTTNSEGYGKFPAMGNLYFHPEPILIQYPQYLSRFHKGDLNGLELDGESADAKLLATAMKIPGLEYLTMYNCSRLTKEDLKKLPALKNLTAINFGKCGFSPDDIADWPGLQKISRLACVDEESRSTDKLLKAITKPRQQLLTLYILNSSVSRKGFQYLAEQPQLSNLFLAGSRFNKHDLIYLVGLKELRKIGLGDTAIDAETVAILKEFKYLKEVSFNFQNSKNLSLGALRKALPGLFFCKAQSQIERGSK